MAKKIFIGFSLLYTFAVYALFLTVTKTQDAIHAHAMFTMAFLLFIVWVLIGGWIQRRYIMKHYEKITEPKKHPILFFAFTATLLACGEEAITTFMTNQAPNLGSAIGKSYITASTNFFDVIFFHSVIVFVPMFFVLGYILKKYNISPFKAFILFGLIGVVAEVMFSGPSTAVNAPFWIFVYGLMVYLPAHYFVRMERRDFSFLQYPIFVIMILASASLTAWIPAVQNHPSIHFEKMDLEAELQKGNKTTPPQ